MSVEIERVSVMRGEETQILGALELQPDLLFECPSRALAGDLQSHEAAAFLSGLLIASDVTGTLSVFAPTLQSRAVKSISAPQLTGLHANGLARQDYEIGATAGALAAVAGRYHVRGQLKGRLGTHAD